MLIKIMHAMYKTLLLKKIHGLTVGGPLAGLPYKFMLTHKC